VAPSPLVVGELTSLSYTLTVELCLHSPTRLCGVFPELTILSLLYIPCNRNNPAGIITGYGLDKSRFDSNQVFHLLLFATGCKLSHGPTILCNGTGGPFSGDKMAGT